LHTAVVGAQFGMIFLIEVVFLKLIPPFGRGGRVAMKTFVLAALVFGMGCFLAYEGIKAANRSGNWIEGAPFSVAALMAVVIWTPKRLSRWR